MSDTEDQMGLFELGAVPPVASTPPPAPAPEPPIPAPAPTGHPSAESAPKTKPRVSAPAPSKRKNATRGARGSKREAPRAPKRVSGLVPEGDVRLTANIRQDLHLKLKIAAAYGRTTIGDLIEELVEKHLR